MRILGNNNQNIWPCPHCYEKTRHIRISVSEGLSSDPKVSQTLKKTGRIVGGLGDLLGTARVCEYMMNCYYWKCLNCGTITLRKVNGEIRRIFDEFE